MNRREFWMTAGGATALSIVGSSSVRSLWASTSNSAATTPLSVKGLAMLSFGDPDFLRIALPEAPHHQGTLAFTPAGEIAESHPIHGNGRLTGSEGSRTRPDVHVPALVDVQELYPGAHSRIEKSPSIISVPWSAVVGISAESVSEDRWTFVEKETGEEVITFRRRQVAESIRFDLVSSGTLEMDKMGVSIDLAEVDEVSTEFIPTEHDMGGYTDHFAFYMPYVERGANAQELEPKQLTGIPASAPMPQVGNSFAARMWPFSICYPFRVD